MKLALMQPYFFPYIGYYQLLANSDIFVFYDDVNFIKNGWLNRNRIGTADGWSYITIPLSKPSPFQKINTVAVEPDRWRGKMLETLRHVYRRAPYFDSVMELVRETIEYPSNNLAEIAKTSVASVAGFLEVKTPIVTSSNQYNNASLSGVDRIIDICRIERVTTYVNSPGGRALYAAEQFSPHGLELCFVDTRLPTYKNGQREFERGLSIIDVLMYNSAETVKNWLKCGLSHE